MPQSCSTAALNYIEAAGGRNLGDMGGTDLGGTWVRVMRLGG